MSKEENIINAKITDVSLNMKDHGVLVFYLTLDGYGWGCNYGGYILGKGYLGSKEFEGNAKGLEALMRIMDVVGVQSWEEIKGKYVRVINPDWGNVITTIGNIVENKWFNAEEFFENEGKQKQC